MNWMIFMVDGGREFFVASKLRGLGVAVRVPAETVTKIVGPKKQIRKAPKAIASRYVFARWQKRIPSVFDLERIEHLHGAMQIGDRLCHVTSAELDVMQEEARLRQNRPQKARFKPGDQILLGSVPFTVEAVEGAALIGFSDLLGKRHRQRIPIDSIQAHPG